MELYTEAWFPRSEAGEMGIEKVAAGGRPLQTTLTDRKLAMIHERMMELLTSVQPGIIATITPSKVVELFKLGDGDPPTLKVGVHGLANGFYSFLGFTRLNHAAAIRRAIARGAQERLFAYTSGGVPVLDGDKKCLAPAARVHFGTSLAEDKIDLESGFVMVPGALPAPPLPRSR